MNDALREHVTSIGFALTLSKRQIDLLCVLHHFKDLSRFHDWEHGDRSRVKHFAHCVTTVRALSARGLVSPIPGNWSLTKAGHLTVALLKECGIYQDRMADLGITLKTAAA